MLEFFQGKVLAAARPKDQEGGLGIDATIREAVDAAEPAIAKTFADQPTVEASIRNTLGESYWYLGESDLAVRQHERALALQRRVLGPDHPDTLVSLNNLALAYYEAGRVDEALPLHEEARGGGGPLGPDHPLTLLSMNNFGNAYRQAGRVAEGLPLLEEALRCRRAQLGPDHPDTIKSMLNLAQAYDAADRTAEAVQLHEEGLKRSRAQLGPDHPITLKIMNNLALAYMDSGRLAEALAMCKDTLERRRARLGPDHFDTLTSMHNLAVAYNSAGRIPPNRFPLFEDALKRLRGPARARSPRHDLHARLPRPNVPGRRPAGRRPAAL